MIRDLIGIPFEEANCLDLARRALATRGVELPCPYQQIANEWEEGNLDELRIVPATWREISKAELQLGDVVLHDGVRGGHVVVIAEDGWALTTTPATGSRLIQVRRLLRDERIRGCWRPA